jgi:hypothetical protein
MRFTVDILRLREQLGRNVMANDTTASREITAAVGSEAA